MSGQDYSLADEVLKAAQKNRPDESVLAEKVAMLVHNNNSLTMALIELTQAFGLLKEELHGTRHGMRMLVELLEEKGAIDPREFDNKVADVVGLPRELSDQIIDIEKSELSSEEKQEKIGEIMKAWTAKVESGELPVPVRPS